MENLSETAPGPLDPDRHLRFTRNFGKSVAAAEFSGSSRRVPPAASGVQELQNGIGFLPRSEEFSSASTRFIAQRLDSIALAYATSSLETSSKTASILAVAPYSKS
jgi:hypothetical protein